MARDKDQQFIFNDEELSLIKNTFADDDTLLYTVRKVFLQFPLTDVERGLIKMSITPQVWAVLKKRILPEISDEFPIGQLPSILTTLQEPLKVRTVEEMEPLFQAKRIELDYLQQQFAVLKDVEANIPEPIRLTTLGDISEATINGMTPYARLTAYLFLLGYIDPMLNFIKSIAGEKKETVEKQKERLARNSSK
jgi:hypothetical protein